MKYLAAFIIPVFLLAGLPGISLAAEASTTAALEQDVERLQKELAAKKEQLASIRAQHVKESAVVPAEAEPTALNPLSNIIKRISLRNSVFNENGFQKDATISYTRPGNGVSSYAIDAGLKFDLQPQFLPFGNTISSSLGVEYHRNSNLATLKNLLQFGAEFEDVLGFAATWPVLFDVTGNVSYKIDDVRDFHSLNGKVKFLPVIYFERMGLDGLRFLNTDNFQRLGSARWRWQLFFEVQYEDTVQTNSGTMSGHHALCDYGAELRLYPFFSTRLGTKVEFTATYKGWTPLSTGGIFSGEQPSSYFETELTYWFDAPNPLSIGEKTADKAAIGLTVGYQAGDNLETGDMNLDLLSLAMHIRF